jgi:hypothetical protein
MKAKLIKVDNKSYYNLENEKGILIGTTFEFKNDLGENLYNLSLKNCQAIERGYDLDELAKASMNKINILFNNSLDSKSHTIGFKAGWHHAIKILGDKKFSEEDVAYIINIMQIHTVSFDEDIFKLQSLQQTEWDVIILEEPIDLAFYENGNRFPIDVNLPDRFKYKPLLDADGCLILKRKI